MSYGFGIIGLGLIADFHAKAIQAISGSRGTLVACCSRSPQKAKDFAEKYNCRGYSDLRDFLAHPPAHKRKEGLVPLFRRYSPVGG